MKKLFIAIQAAFLLTLSNFSVANASDKNPDFRSGEWTPETEVPQTIIRFAKDTLEIDAPKGITLWYNKPLCGDYTITYSAKMVMKGGANDRLSDLNCFWNANDAENPADFFARSAWRKGTFGRYYSLKLYYVGYGGNNNTTSRFRKYDGDFAAFQAGKVRPDIIREYTDSAHLLKPNKWYRVKIEVKGNRMRYSLDGVVLFDFTDGAPYTNGYFGFRTVQSHQLITGFKITSAVAVAEKLNRAPVAVASPAGGAYISWRLLPTDDKAIAFNLYRITNNQKKIKLNNLPILKTTDFVDKAAPADKSCKYELTPVVNGKEINSESNTFVCQPNNYISVSLQKPADGTTKDGKVNYSYVADDASVGDLDGDGDLEIVQKWVAEGKGKSDYWGPMLYDAYEMDGTLLWRINLGINCKSDGFLVYDVDGDGCAELVTRTGDGTTSARGEIVGDATADWVAKGGIVKGFVMDGPEYFTIFDGKSGGIRATQEYAPTRYPLDGWGGKGGNGANDKIGNRANKFLAAIAYLDGKKPSIIFTRGYFGRTVIVAWDYANGKISQRWIFDSGISYPPYTDASPFSGMGNHNLTVADVDADGRDEIVFGSMVVDDNGKGLFSTGFRHGDALHVGDFDLNNPGLEVFGPHENEGGPFDSWGVTMYAARDGKPLFALGDKEDVGRGVSADVDPRNPGAENWGGRGGLRDCAGKTISQKAPCSMNFTIYWDADAQSELLDKNHIDKWNWKEERCERLLQDTLCSSNNGTKAVPCFSGDILGDWREEVIWRTRDSRELRIYTTTFPASFRLKTLLSDHQYRLSLVWQNVAYNQPPHLSFDLQSRMFPVRK